MDFEFALEPAFEAGLTLDDLDDFDLDDFGLDDLDVGPSLLPGIAMCSARFARRLAREEPPFFFFFLVLSSTALAPAMAPGPAYVDPSVDKAFDGTRFGKGSPKNARRSMYCWVRCPASSRAMKRSTRRSAGSARKRQT